MKLKELKPVIRSITGGIQLCIVFDFNEARDLDKGCSVEYAYEIYGERTVRRVSSIFVDGRSYILFTIE